MSEKDAAEKVLPRDKDVHPPTTDGARTREIASGDGKKETGNKNQK